MATRPISAAFDTSGPLDGLGLQPVETKSRSDWVYDQLRDRLMRGAFKPHQRLRVSDLSRGFGTSETPIREALVQLVRDGAVDAKPHAYFRVRKLSLAEYYELREIRLALEPLAAVRALGAIADAAIDRLASLHEVLVQAEACADYDAAVWANFDFHFGIYRCARMPQLIAMLETLWVRHGPMLNHLYPHGAPSYEGRHQHEVILEALRRRDGTALATAIQNDMIEGGRNFVRRLEALEAAEREGEEGLS
jgi:DNA-binding GntR family transcriptional regulator